METEDEGIPATSIREISILRELSHEHVVDLIDVVSHSKKLSLIFEHLDQDLGHMMKGLTRPLSSRVTQSYLRQTMDTLLCCHSHRIVHRNLKPQVNSS